jgi:hypothetical protein
VAPSIVVGLNAAYPRSSGSDSAPPSRPLDPDLPLEGDSRESATNREALMAVKKILMLVGDFVEDYACRSRPE